MCEVVEQLGEHFEARFEAIEKCRELVGDHPEEREEVGYRRWSWMAASNLMFAGTIVVKQRGEKY